MINIKVCSLCMVKFAGDMYPAIFINNNKSKALCYVFHLDSVHTFDEIFKIKKGCMRMIHLHSPIEYSLMESPSVFSFNNTMCFKWGNNAYTMTGEKVEVKNNAVCSKILSAPLM